MRKIDTSTPYEKYRRILRVPLVVEQRGTKPLRFFPRHHLAVRVRNLKGCEFQAGDYWAFLLLISLLTPIITWSVLIEVHLFLYAVKNGTLKYLLPEATQA